jgi:hypothetical protein
VRGRCGDARLQTEAGAVALQPLADVRALEAGEPLAAGACGEARLPGGEQDVRGLDGVLRVDHLRMSTGEPRTETVQLDEILNSPGGPDNPGGRDRVDALGEAEPEIERVPPAGRVVDPGEQGRGERAGVELDVDRPSWLVLGESYNRGWRATCDGEDLGEPVPLQGYANAWRVEPGCREVDMAWAPNRLLPPAYLISLLAVLACPALLAIGRRRRGVGRLPAPMAPELDQPLDGALPDDAPARRWPLRSALAAGALAAVVLGFVFAIRAGVVLGPATAFILWRGLSSRQLALAGGALLLTVVPVLYLAVPVDNPGGYNTNLAVERIAAHWVGVGAVFLLSTAMVRAVAAARSGP